MHDRLSPEIATTPQHHELHMKSVDEDGNKESEWDVEEKAKIWRNASPTWMWPRTAVKSLHKSAP